MGDGLDVQNIAEAVDDIKQQQQMYKTKVEEVQTLMEEMRHKLDRAKADLRSAVRGILVISQIKMKLMVVLVMKVLSPDRSFHWQMLRGVLIWCPLWCTRRALWLTGESTL